jgi:cell division protein FtsZ
MIEFEQDSENTVPPSTVRIVGLGGAGTNMLDRVALDGMDGAGLMALNTDVRTLSAAVAAEKIQLGKNLTKGLGAGGDPELGRQATLEAEDAIRKAFKGQRIVFLCVGLGGGTGSGGAPLVARIAREEGAFVVSFATMPFSFEGRRRREQAEEALNQLVVLSNALVTFDNGRMGELVLAKQGVHEAFAAADRMISESIKAVIRLVIRPGLINVGLDDLMSALRTPRSRCLFGSGSAEGKDRAARALRNALSSPLLDKGALLRQAETVLVHLCGGEDLTLYEIELMMQNLGKHVPEDAHVLFGAAVDPGMGKALSVTLVSALPEERLRVIEEAGEEKREEPEPEQKSGPESPPAEKASEDAPADPEPAGLEPSEGFGFVGIPEQEADEEPEIVELSDLLVDSEEKPEIAAEFPAPEPEVVSDIEETEEAGDPEEMLFADIDKPDEPEAGTSVFEKPEDLPFAETIDPPEDELEFEAFEEKPAEKMQPLPTAEKKGKPKPNGKSGAKSRKRPSPKGKFKKIPAKQAELAFDGGPTGKFAGESPNVFEGENLDIPAFLRKKKK